MRRELSDPAVSVASAIYGAGFNSSGRFYAAAPGVLGMTPTSFRSGGTGASIHFAVGECSLGSVLVAATEGEHELRAVERTALRAEQALGHHWGTFQLTDEGIERPPEAPRVSVGVGGMRHQIFRDHTRFDPLVTELRDVMTTFAMDRRTREARTPLGEASPPPPA